ncbi:MAG: MazG family protein, partial [Planctomycetota bacterium]
MTDSPLAPTPVPDDDPRLRAFAQLLAVVDALRAPGGCPWDREQTEATMAPRLVEEAHEFAEAVESGGGDARASEAGDCLVALLMVCRIAEDGEQYDLGRIAELASNKLVRRHPHVFGPDEVEGTGEVLRNWEEIKRAEREEAGDDTSALAGVPRTLPGLQRAGRVCQKAVAAGFHWEDARGALGKVEEELRELIEVLPADALAESA